MNNVTLSGRLTKEPDVRYGGENNSVAIARFTLAVDDYKSTGTAEAAGSRRQTTANTQRRRLYGHTRRLRRRATIRLKSSAAAESEE